MCFRLSFGFGCYTALVKVKDGVPTLYETFDAKPVDIKCRNTRGEHTTIFVKQNPVDPKHASYFCLAKSALLIERTSTSIFTSPNLNDRLLLVYQLLLSPDIFRALDLAAALFLHTASLSPRHASAHCPLNWSRCLADAFRERFSVSSNATHSKYPGPELSEGV